MVRLWYVLLIFVAIIKAVNYGNSRVSVIQAYQPVWEE